MRSVKQIVFFVLNIILLVNCFSQTTSQNKPTHQPLIEDKIEALQQNLIEASNDSLKTNALIALGEYHLNRDFSKVNDYLKTALKLASKTNNQYQIATIYADLGIMYRRKSDYTEAIDYYLKSKSIFNRLNDSVNVSALNHNLGVLYRFLNDYETSIKHYKDAIDIRLKLKDKKNDLAISYNMLGVSYRKSNQLDSALYFYKKAKTIFKELKNEANIYRVNGNLAVLYSRQNNSDKSLLLNKQNLEYYSRTKNEASMCTTLYNISVEYFKKHNYDLALSYCDRLIEIAKKSQFKDRLKIAYKKKSEILEFKNDYKNAYKNYILYKKYSDSILDKEGIKKIKALELTYKFDQEKLRDSLRYEKQKQISESQIHQLTSKNKTITFWLIFGSLGLISVFWILFLYKKNEYSKRKQFLQRIYSQNLIEAQENEKTKIARDLHDSVGQKLMLLTRNIKSLNDKNLEKLATSTLSELRSISRELHPESIENIGLTTAIKTLVNEFDQHTEHFFSMSIEDVDTYCDTNMGIHIFRIIQESIANSIKHSKSTAISLKIQKIENLIYIKIEDNGTGFDITSELNKKNSLGLRTMLERTKILNGKFHIKNKKPSGTQTTISIPCQK